MDKLIIEGLTVFANHGVHEEENVLGQKFEVSAELYLDMRKAGQTDQLYDTVNYGDVCRFIEKTMKNHTLKLLEAVAEQLCEEILLNYPAVRKLKLRLDKPWAPVKLPLHTVAVEIERSWHKVFIGIGSNMGDRQGYLDRGVEALGQVPNCRLLKVSDYLETKAWGKTDQDDFLNAAIEIETMLSPEELLWELLDIERANGRVRDEHWGPRTLDMDILLYDNEIIETETLCIPHMWMHKRAFVLEPLSQIAPYRRHPVYGKTMLEMLRELKKDSAGREKEQ